ncbi:MAG: hypothetical protein ACXADO_00820 [Candidatus Thorarchaeota archaeon]|jgi:hypothetical protein
MGDEWPWPGYKIPDCFGDRGMFCLDDCVVSCPVSEDCKNEFEGELEEGYEDWDLTEWMYDELERAAITIPKTETKENPPSQEGE